MTDYTWEDCEPALERMLKAGGYETVEEWAHDSDYLYDDDYDMWYDDDGYAVDIESKAVDAAWEAGYFEKDDK